jgi:hypothetical protein
MQEALHVVFAHALVYEPTGARRVRVARGVAAYELAYFVENVLDEFSYKHLSVIPYKIKS